MATYKELTIPLAWDCLEALLEFLDGLLTARGHPTARRLCVSAAVEELFCCAMAAGGGSGVLTCRGLPSGYISFCFLRNGVPFLPELADLEALAAQIWPRDLSLHTQDGACLLLPAHEPQAT